MLYIVTGKYPKDTSMSLDQILFGESNTSSHKERTYPGTVTKCYKDMPDGLYTKDDIQRLINKLAEYVQIYEKVEKKYHHFEIPKKSGGMRHICEPYETLKFAQIELRKLITNDIGPLYHTSAFAYCKGRNTLNCIKKHQANKSNWFLKLDFSDFFGSTNKNFVMSQLRKIVPFNLIIEDDIGKIMLEKSLDMCFLNNGLPQGTPISPMLTNIIMIPFDHELNRRLHKKGLVYTRYADDIQISGRYHFDVNEIIKIVKEVVHQVQAPYTLNETKTRFGSKKGKNWNLGLMLNKDNKITIGHKQHKFLKANIPQADLLYFRQQLWESRALD